MHVIHAYHTLTCNPLASAVLYYNKRISGVFTVSTKESTQEL